MTGKNPLQPGFSFALWTCRMIQNLIRKCCGVRLSLASVEQWLKREYPRIRALAIREKAETFFADESEVRSDFHNRRT